MKKSATLLLAIMSVLFLFSAGNTSAQSKSDKKSFDLAYKVQAGKSFTIKSEGSSVMKSEQNGQTIDVQMLSLSETAFRALKPAADGGMDYEMEFKSRSQSVKSTMGNGDTDFKSWIGKKTTFSVSPSGALSNYGGFEQLEDIATTTGEKVTGDMIKKGMSVEFFKLPGHAVKIGESWSVSDTADIPYNGGTLKSIETSTFTAAEKVKKDGFDCLKLDVTSVSSLTGAFEQQGTQIELTRETKSTGVTYFALDKGMYLSIESNATGNTQIYVPAASMTIPQEITSKLSMKVVFD